MEPQLCVLVSYLYRRVQIPHSVQWHMNAYRLPGEPEMRMPGFLEQKGDANQLGITLAVPCLANGEIQPETQDEYEELADDHFGQLRPGQELA